MEKWQLIFYERSGRCPVQTYLDDLRKSNENEYRLLMEKVNLLEEFGTGVTYFLGNKFYKPLRDGIFELKYKKHRLLYFYHKNKIIILLHGFRKDSDKTPESEIENAKREREYYLCKEI